MTLPRASQAHGSEAQTLAEQIQAENGYREVRVLSDGSIAAILDLITTRAIILGCTQEGWASRFCFADCALADQRFSELMSEDDQPEGFIARRGLALPGYLTAHPGYRSGRELP